MSIENKDDSVLADTMASMDADINTWNKRVKTARLLLFIVGGLSLLFLVLFGIFVNWENWNNWTALILPAYVLILLTTAFLSYKEPFIFLLIGTILYGITFIFFTLRSIDDPSENITAIGRTLVQAVILLYLIRGIIAAKKCQTLKARRATYEAAEK